MRNRCMRIRKNWGRFRSRIPIPGGTEKRRGIRKTGRAFVRLKDEFGFWNLRVREYQKMMCHMMFGVLALTVDSLLRLAA